MRFIMLILYPILIVKEWMECEEFKNTDKIIVIGSKFYAAVVNFLFRRSEKKVYYYSERVEKYRYHSKTKWIVFDKSLKGNLPLNSYDVLIVPALC